MLATDVATVTNQLEDAFHIVITVPPAQMCFKYNFTLFFRILSMRIWVSPLFDSAPAVLYTGG